MYQSYQWLHILIFLINIIHLHIWGKKYWSRNKFALSFRIWSWNVFENKILQNTIWIKHRPPIIPALFSTQLLPELSNSASLDQINQDKINCLFFRHGNLDDKDNIKLSPNLGFSSLKRLFIEFLTNWNDLCRLSSKFRSFSSHILLSSGSSMSLIFKTLEFGSLLRGLETLGWLQQRAYYHNWEEDECQGVCRLERTRR